MMLDTLLDPLFRQPLITGLLVAATLSVMGVLLRLRNEWLAALGFAHLSGVTALALLGLPFHLPATFSAICGSMLGAIIKHLGQFRGNSIYAVMILVGWAGTLLIAANTALGSVMSHAIIEGQIFFSGTPELIAATVLTFSAWWALPWLIPRLIRARFSPMNEIANRLPIHRWHLGFDLLTAASMAIGTATIGLMGAFALIFLPAWTAFRLTKNWKQCISLSLTFGVGGYLLSFAVAIVLDQPFGPILVTVQLLIASLSLIGKFSLPPLSINTENKQPY